MTLGYCILHANRIDAAITGMREDATAADEGIDLGLGAVALHDAHDLVGGYLAGVQTELHAFIQRIEQAFASGGGVLGDLQRWIHDLGQARFDELRLTPWVDRLGELVVALEPVVLAGKLDALLERIAIALPELNGGGLLDRLVAIALGGLEVLERRRLAGHDDLAAHRAFRMARIVRFWLGEALAGLRARAASIDLMAMVRGALRGLLGGVASPGADVLRGLGDALRTKIRPFAVAIDALLAVRVSVHVDAQVQLLPEPGKLWLDDNLTTPHDASHPLWWLDLASGINAAVFTIIDVQRFNPFQGQRTWDAICSVINLAWQTVRTIVRAVRPDFLKRNHSTTGGAFWFGELGDFCVQLFLNLVPSLIYEAPDAGSNWVMSLACRLARWFTFTLQPRMPYIFARAIWYMRAWHEGGFVRDRVVGPGETIESIASAESVDPIRLRIWNRIIEGGQPAVGDTLVIPVEEHAAGARRAKLSMIRHAWATWMWMWIVSVFDGALQGWDDMQVDKLGDTRFAKVGVWLGPLLGLIAGIVVPIAFTGGKFAGIDYEVDWASFTALLGMWLLLIGMISGSMYSANVTREKWWIFFIIALPVCLLLFALVLGYWLKPGSNQEVAGGLLYTATLVEGLVIFGLVVTLLWWIYIDDGRDKQGMFTGLDVASTPYMLPWDKDKVWVCGQGFHGIFSHYLRRNAGNHYGYDFLEGRDEPGLAARSGWVVSIHQRSPYGSPDQNDVAILHSEWRAGHDPGTDLERVQTGSHYIHIGPNCARMDIDQRIIQGQNIIDIDSTGLSAQQHMHFGAGDLPLSRWWTGWSGRNTRLHPLTVTSRPVIFADQSLRRDRTNPILRPIPGHVHHDGRPLAQCLYRSDNQRKTGPARPLILTTRAQTHGALSHTHELRIDVAALPLDGNLTSTLTLTTSFAEGHRHEVQISAAQMVELLRHALPEGWTTQPALASTLAHSHEFAAEPFAGSSIMRADSPIAQVGVTAPPSAQLIATKRGPYDMLDKRVVVRVDDQHTEFFGFAGTRARLIADVAMLRAPRQVDSFSVRAVGATPVMLSGFPARSSALAGVGKSDQALRDTSIGARALPVLVLETRARSAAAQIEITAASTALVALGIDPAGVQAKGSGSLPGRTMTHTQLRDAFRLELNGPDPVVVPPPPAPPPPPVLHAPAAADVHAQALALPATTIDIANVAIDFEGSARAKTIFTALYDRPNKRLVGDGALPLGCGRFTLQKSGTLEQLEVPLVGSAAAVQLDPALAWLTGADLAASPLIIGVGVEEVALRIAGATSLAAIATMIGREVGGVRAWEQAGKLWIETLDFGPSVTLRVSKRGPSTTFSVSATGSAPGLLGGASIDDSGLITRAELIRAIHDAATLADRKLAVAAGTKVRVSVDQVGNHLHLEVPAGKTIALVEASSSAPLFALLAPSPLPTPATHQLDLRELAAVELPVGGWLDFQVDGELRRVHLDAEPAQLELPPPPSWPAAGETLVVRVDGGAAVSIDVGALDSLDALADALVNATKVAGQATLALRVAHRLALEARATGSTSVQVTSAGAEPFGFVSRTAHRLAEGIGSAPDLRAIANGSGFERARKVTRGTIIPGALTASAPVTTGAAHRVELQATQGRQIQIGWDGSGPSLDPFGLIQPAPVATLAGTSFETLALPQRALAYWLTLTDPGAPNASGMVHVTLSASPAELRADHSIGLLPLVGATSLRIRLTSPSRTLNVELPLGWLSEFARAEQGINAGLQLDLQLRVIDLIQRKLPLLDAWLIEGANGAWSLCLQTRGAGKGWQVRLENEAAIVALGFDPARIVGGALIAEGQGDFVDEQKVLASEVATAFTRAAAWVTFGEHAKYRVSHSAGVVRVEAEGTPAPAITLRTEPASFRDQLRARVVGPALEFDLRRPLDLGGGQIIIERDGQPAALVFVQGSCARLVSTAALPSSGSAAETDELGFFKHLGPSDVTIAVDGVATSIRRVPASITTHVDLIAELAKQVPAARFTIIAGGQLRIESRTRGSGSAVALSFAAGVIAARAHGSLLGCTSNVSESGEGRFRDLAQVDAAELVSALQEVRDDAVFSQNLIACDFDAATHELRVRASDPRADLSHVLGRPIRLVNGTNASLSGSGNLIRLAWPGPAALVQSVTQLRWSGHDMAVGGSLVQRQIDVPLWGASARLQLKVQASTPTAFASHRLALTLQTRDVDVDFVSVPTWASLGLQIERASGGELHARVFERATVDPVGSERILELASTMEGGEARVVVRVATGSTDARQLLAGLAAGPIEARGSGSVPRLDRVDGPALAAAFAHGYVAGEAAFLRSNIDIPTAWRGRYDARPDAPVLRIRSARLGSRSALGVVAGLDDFGFDLSLQRGPAVRAALVIPPGGAVVLPTPASLPIVFDDNGTGPDVAPARRITVEIPARTWSRDELAAHIHAALFGPGAGTAAAFPDGSIVIETLTPGLAGTVALPSDGRVGADPLGLVETGLRRGWPGSHRFEDAEGFRRGSNLGSLTTHDLRLDTPYIPVRGWRGAHRQPSAGIEWVFRSGPPTMANVWTSPRLTLQAGWSAEQLVAEVDRVLASATSGANTKRIGFAKLGSDEVLHIEAAHGEHLVLEVKPSHGAVAIVGHADGPDVSRLPPVGTSWRFLDGAPTKPGVLTTPAATMAVGMNEESWKRELDDALGRASDGTTTRRIGEAEIYEVDSGGGVMQKRLRLVGSGGDPLYLEVPAPAGASGPIGCAPKPGLGERVDIEVEPGLDLRATDTLRTYRLVYDRKGAGETSNASDFIDTGWLRPRTDPLWGTTRDHVSYEPLDGSAWPRGRYLLAARAEAAAQGYGGTGEMVESFGSATIAGHPVHFIRVARYFVGLTCMTDWNLQAIAGEAGLPGRNARPHEPLMMGVRLFDGQVLVDWLV